jgi:hypothetical protein
MAPSFRARPIVAAPSVLMLANQRSNCVRRTLVQTQITHPDRDEIHDLVDILAHPSFYGHVSHRPIHACIGSGSAAET